MTPIPATIGPTSADWLGAWSTLAAAIGTVGTLVLGLILWRLDRRRDRRAQARLVHGFATRSQETLPVFIVENNSEGVIRFVHLPRDDGAILQLALMVRAGSRQERPIENPEEPERLGLVEGGAEEVPITVSFIDQAGVRWTHHWDGRLEESPDP